MKTTLRRTLGLALAAVTIATLAACGGCDDTTLTVRGVGAKGLAIVGGAVTVECAAGNATTSTSDTGSYIVSITNGVGPCVVTLDDNGTKYRSITVEKTTSLEVANVNPITEAIVQSLLVSKGAMLTDDATVLVKNASTAVTAEDLTAAVQKTVTELNKALGSNQQIPPGTDLLGGDFIAKTDDIVSTDPVDLALDILIAGTSVTLDSTLVGNITTAVKEVVDPNPTGSTGASGGVN